MKSPRHFLPSCLFLALLVHALGMPSATAADRGPTYRRDFTINGVAKRLYFKVRDFTVAEASDETVEQWKIDMTDWAEGFWRGYELAGFKSPANRVDPDGVEALEYFLEKGDYAVGNASETGDIRIASPVLGPTHINRSLRAVIAHEMFHSVQFRYAGINARYLDSFREGTATLAAELMDLEVYQHLATNASCATGYLANPGGQMWFRPGGDLNANVCHPAIWWKYLTQQFSNMDPLDYQQGLDTLQRLLVHLETPTGWQQAATDIVAGIGDFDGDDLDDLLVRSDLYIGTLSPMFFNPETLAVVPDGGRFGGGWLFDSADEILAVADLGGDRKPEMVIRSATHLGVIGTDDDGGFVTLHVVELGSRLGTNGWLTAGSDVVAGVGDFDGDGKSELCLQSPTHLGLVDYDTGAGFSTRATLLVNDRFGTGWLFKSSDTFVGTGDFNGDGVADLAIKSATHYGFVSYDPAAGAFETLAVKSSGSTVEVGWSIAVTDNFFGVGRLDVSATDSLLVQTGSGIVAVSAPSPGTMYMTAAITHANLGTGFEMVAAIADMDGNGRHELVTQLTDGGIRLFEKGAVRSFSQTAGMTSGEVLRDGYNGEETRQSWTVADGYQVLAKGDLDGDGQDELFIRSGGRTLTLHLNDAGDFLLGTVVYDGNRYDSLVDKLDSFIRAESFGTRTLRSMFTDFTVANYANSLDWTQVGAIHQYSDTLTYPNSINHDHSPTTPPVVFTLEELVDGSLTQSITQQPWTVQYYHLTSTGDGLELAIQNAFGIENAVFTLLIERNGNLVHLSQHEGAELAEWLALHSGDRLILMVTTLEAPLEYSLQLESTMMRMISIDVRIPNPDAGGVTHIDILWESVPGGLYTVYHAQDLAGTWSPIEYVTGDPDHTSYRDKNLIRINQPAGFYRVGRTD